MAAPTVKEAAPLPASFRSHAQSTLVDNRVLVSGGDDSDPFAFASTFFYKSRAEAYLYDPETNRWSNASPMTQPMCYHAQTTLAGGLVVVCGGQTNKDTFTADAQVYDPTSDRWTAVAPMKTPRRYHSASTLGDGRALVCGGATTGYSPTAEVEIYDPRSNTWTQAAPMPAPITRHTQSTLTDGRVLVCGKGGKVPTTCTYNPETNHWTTASHPKELVGRAGASQTTLADGRVLVAGGYVDGKCVRTTALYTPTTDTWTPGPDLPCELCDHAASMLPSKDVLISGGCDSEDLTSRVHLIQFEPANPPSPTAVAPPAAAKDREMAALIEEIRRMEEEKEIETRLHEAALAEARQEKLALEEQVGTTEQALAEAQSCVAAARIIAANADAAEADSAAAIEALRALVAASPGLSLEMFEIIARIGVRSRPTAFHQFYGVNSAVFEVVLDGRVVVIKVVFNVEQATESNLSDTFKTDYALIEDPSKSHPNVVAGLGHFVGEASKQTLGEAWDANPEYVRRNTLFIVMEPMDKSLKKLISDLSTADDAGDRGRSAWPPVLPMPVFKVVMQRVLRAVEELFRLGIVHRDLKADNVLINYQPAAAEEGRVHPTVLVKLADFGHALDTTTEDSIEDFKMPYLVRSPKGGAPAYLAPEVVAAEPGTLRNLTFIDYSKNDVFAAGMLAHYMLTNGVEDAFATRDPEYTAVHHPNYSAATYNHLPPECPKPIADLVWAMVNPSFEHRITAEEALARVDAMIYVSDTWA